MLAPAASSATASQLRLVPHGVCVIEDRAGTRALGHVTEAMCGAGYVTNDAPLPSFVCEPARAEEEDDVLGRRSRGAVQDVMRCAILPGKWVTDAAVRLEDAATGSTICWAVADASALGDGLEFALPGSRVCTADEVAAAALAGNGT
jgi:hypothetical protein